MFAKDKECSMAKFLRNPDIREQFNLPLSEQAFDEYNQLMEDIKRFLPINNCPDSWT